jgi:hypothetical protein
MTNFPSALMQKANELHHHISNLDTYGGDYLDQAILTKDIIYHAKELLLEVVDQIDGDVEWLTDGIVTLDQDGELDTIIEELKDDEPSDWDEHSTWNKNGTGCK